MKSFPVQPPTNYLNFTDFRQHDLTLTHYKYNLQWKKNFFASRRKKDPVVKNSQILGVYVQNPLLKYLHFNFPSYIQSKIWKTAQGSTFQVLQSNIVSFVFIVSW